MENTVTTICYDCNRVQLFGIHNVFWGLDKEYPLDSDGDRLHCGFCEQRCRGNNCDDCSLVYTYSV